MLFLRIDLSLHMALAFSIVQVAVLFKSVSRIVTNSPDPVEEKITEFVQIDLGQCTYKQLKWLENQ